MLSTLENLFNLARERKKSPVDGSYTNKLLNDKTLSKEKVLEEKLKVAEQFNYNGVIGEMLRDTGIKTKIIKQYLPAINKLVNQHLQVLDFFVSFDLDESFQETIRSRYRDDFTYESFSEGEKQRIDLSLLFTWRQIAKMKNSVATNLLILDETFDSSLDHDGIENLLKILYTLDADTNTFIISNLLIGFIFSSYLSKILILMLPLISGSSSCISSLFIKICSFEFSISS